MPSNIKVLCMSCNSLLLSTTIEKLDWPLNGGMFQSEVAGFYLRPGSINLDIYCPICQMFPFRHDPYQAGGNAVGKTLNLRGADGKPKLMSIKEILLSSREPAPLSRGRDGKKGKTVAHQLSTLESEKIVGAPLPYKSAQSPGEKPASGRLCIDCKWCYGGDHEFTAQCDYPHPRNTLSSIDGHGVECRFARKICDGEWWNAPSPAIVRPPKEVEELTKDFWEPGNQPQEFVQVKKPTFPCPACGAKKRFHKRGCTVKKNQGVVVGSSTGSGCSLKRDRAPEILPPDPIKDEYLKDLQSQVESGPERGDEPVSSAEIREIERERENRQPSRRTDTLRPEQEVI